MISRFSRRSISLLLALVTLCMCCVPALIQPAEAVAGIDDATLAVGLLFLSWAGVTFATSQGAYTATTNFLNSSVNGLKAASDVASKFVVDNTLALAQGVKDAFSSTPPDINSTFKTAPGSTEGSLAGSFPANVPIPITEAPLTLPVDASFTKSNPLVISDSSGPVFQVLGRISRDNGFPFVCLAWDAGPRAECRLCRIKSTIHP